MSKCAASVDTHLEQALVPICEEGSRVDGRHSNIALPLQGVLPKDVGFSIIAGPETGTQYMGVS